jgi:hypothetical protein
MKKILFYITFLTGFSSLMLSCGDERNFLESVQTAEGGRVKFFHAAVDVPGVVISVNDKIVSGVLNTTTNVPAGVTYGSLFPILDYATVPVGTAKVKVTVPATATTPEVNLNASLDVANGKYYTVNAIGNAGNYSFAIIEDDLSVPDPNKTYVRFVNAMATTPTGGIEFLVNNVVTATKTAISNGKEDFIAFDQPGPTRFTIVLRQTGTTAALSTLSSLNFVRGKKYTVVARGLAGSTATATRPTIGTVNNN